MSNAAPNESSPRCFCANVRKASRAITQFYDEQLAASGLVTSQYSLLSTVQRHGPIAMQALADEMAMDRTTLTRNLKPLVNARLIAIESDGDRRRRLATITPKGREVYNAARPRWNKAQKLFTARFGEERSRQLDTLLAATIEGLRS